MNSSPTASPPAFGAVDFDGEHGMLTIETGPGAVCRLTLLARTERGYPRRELAAIPAAIWREIASVAQRELVRGMEQEEQGARPPSLRSGENALSPLILRELTVLFWALMEDGEGTHTDSLLAGWRQLAREERWWLYARASNPAQRQGDGWRRALFYALSDPADTRTAPRLLEIMEAATAQKKKPLAAAPPDQLSGRDSAEEGPGTKVEETSPAWQPCSDEIPLLPEESPDTTPAARGPRKEPPAKLEKPTQLELF